MRIGGGKSHHRADGGNEIGAIERAIEDHAFANAGAEGHHPGGARKRVAGAMVLEAVAAGVFIRVAAKIGKDRRAWFCRRIRVRFG